MGITEFIKRIDDLLDTKLEYEIKKIEESSWIDSKDYAEEKARDEHTEYRDEMMEFIDRMFEEQTKK